MDWGAPESVIPHLSSSCRAFVAQCPAKRTRGGDFAGSRVGGENRGPARKREFHDDQVGSSAQRYRSAFGESFAEQEVLSAVSHGDMLVARGGGQKDGGGADPVPFFPERGWSGVVDRAVIGDELFDLSGFAGRGMLNGFHDDAGEGFDRPFAACVLIEVEID